MPVPDVLDREAPDFPEYQRQYVQDAEEIPEGVEIYVAPLRGEYFLKAQFR